MEIDLCTLSCTGHCEEKKDNRKCVRLLGPCVKMALICKNGVKVRLRVWVSVRVLYR